LALIDSDRDWSQVVPSVLGPLDIAGKWNGVMVAPGTGDNMAAALGVGLRPGDAVISVGTSGTAYSVSDVPTADVTGAVAGFADATGRYLPLVCTSNAAKVFDAFARLLGVDHEELDRLALGVETPGDDQSSGPTLLPYFDGERTPNRPDAAGILAGLRSDISREQFARAAVDGVACGLLDAFDALNTLAPVTGKLLLTGGGARSRALQGVLNGLVDVPVALADADEAVATGAAVQAAAVFEQTDHASIQERWGLGAGSPIDFTVDCGDLRERYAALRDEHV
jgi:xylulokinase